MDLAINIQLTDAARQQLGVLRSVVEDEDIQRRLQAVRETIGHNGTMGDGSENVWLELLRKYLPERYAVEKAFVVDSKDSMSQQIDVVIFDRQYTPFIFVIENQKVVPAESVYAVFEAKQAIDAGMIDYAQKKVASVRRLHRTSLPIFVPVACRYSISFDAFVRKSCPFWIGMSYSPRAGSGAVFESVYSTPMRELAGSMAACR